MVLRRSLLYLRPEAGSTLFAFLLLAVTAAADLARPFLLKIFIDDHLTPGRFEVRSLLLLAGSWLFLLLITAGFNYWQIFTFKRIALRVIQQLRIDLFDRVQNLGLAYFDATPVGALVSRITNDTEAIKELYVNVLASFIKNSAIIGGICVSMMFLDLKLGLCSLVLLPVILVMMIVFRKFSFRIYTSLRHCNSQLNVKLNESLQGMSIIQAMGQEKRLNAEFGDLTRAYYGDTVRNIKLNSLFLMPAIDLLNLAVLSLALTWFGHRAIAGTVSVGVLYAFVNYLGQFFINVSEMMRQLPQLQQALVASGRVFTLLDETSLAPGKTGDGAPLVGEGRVEFRNVSFSYDGVTEILKNISFVAQPGETVALVGHTGSGKSTVVNLLMRFYHLQQGEITLDRIPLTEYDERELRSKVGLVLQDPFLFTGNVRQNIGLHQPEATEVEIMEATRFVQAHDFIDRLPNGYDEPVGERGATFSSGQRQLISFARTMLNRPKVLVLDEATAHVDTETETAIQSAMARIRTGRTTIAIAHRLSTIQDADQILVLQRGEIVERGTHQELLAQQGLYYKMYQLQQGNGG